MFIFMSALLHLIDKIVHAENDITLKSTNENIKFC